MGEPATARRLAAILAADVEGYSRLMGADEVGTIARLKLLRSDHVEPALRRHEGRLVGEAGDSLLVEFASAINAVSCAAELQTKLFGLNADLPDDRRMRFRMGINVGEIIADGATIHGEGVNVAARLEKLAEAGGIVVARSVFDQVRGKMPNRFDDLGELALHNIAEPVRAYRVAVDTPAPPSPAKAPSWREHKATVAVLPFTNMSGDSEQEYFSDGITEDLITALSRFHSLAVAARNSTFLYKGKAVDVQRIGRELGVRYIVEGSVRRAGDRVRVTAQLISAETGAHLWAERYDRQLADIFAVQDEVVNALAAQLPSKVHDAAVIGPHSLPATSLTAYDHYLRAIAAFRRGDIANILGSLRRAIDADPEYATAHAWLAFIYAWGGATGEIDIPEGEAERLAREHIALATSGSEEDSTAHVEVGSTYWALGEHDKARVHLEQARAINPYDPSTAMMLGELRAYVGHHQEGLAMIESAFWSAPRLSFAMREILMETHYLVRDYEAAVQDFVHFERPLAHQYLLLAIAHAQLGRDDDAKRAVAEFEARRPPGFDPRRFADLCVRCCILPEDKEHWLEGFRKARLIP